MVRVERACERVKKALRVFSEAASGDELLPIGRWNNKKSMGEPQAALQDLQDETNYCIEVRLLIDVFSEFKDKLLHRRDSLRGGGLLQEQTGLLRIRRIGTGQRHFRGSLKKRGPGRLQTGGNDWMGKVESHAGLSDQVIVRLSCFWRGRR